MGNKIDSGFNVPPSAYLRDIRKKTNRRFRDIASTRRRSSVMTKDDDSKKTTAELNTESVRDYVITNPAFLDDLIFSYISQDRVKAWLREMKTREDGEKRKDSDPDFTNELAERSFRHRRLLLLTRSRLLYPSRHKKDELNDLIERPQCGELELNIESHLFPYTEIQTEDISKIFIHMSTKLLGKYAFPMPQLCYFLSTVKSNYYNVEYHNYSHALSHAQSMYWILRKNPGAFSELEIKCLLIASIAHDVGHPGVNDNYLKTATSGLEKLYHSPILENHHVQTCFLILQDINCNVFCDLDGDEYLQVLDEIEHAILSTSLPRYKTQRENMRHMIATDLNFQKQEVRDAAKSMMMMCCDLCSSWKSWNEHKNIVWSIYKEFFAQGDKEMNFQMESLPMMMRMNSDKIPEYQVRFLKNVSLITFEVLVKVFPNTSVIVDATTENLELWNTYL